MLPQIISLDSSCKPTGGRASKRKREGEVKKESDTDGEGEGG